MSIEQNLSIVSVSDGSVSNSQCIISTLFSICRKEIFAFNPGATGSLVNSNVSLLFTGTGATVVVGSSVGNVDSIVDVKSLEVVDSRGVVDTVDVDKSGDTVENVEAVDIVDGVGNAVVEGPFEDVIISIGVLECVDVNVENSEDVDGSDVDCVGNAVVEASLDVTISIGVEECVDANDDDPEDVVDCVDINVDELEDVVDCVDTVGSDVDAIEVEGALDDVIISIGIVN